jgi:hypothetical protein
MSCRGFAFIKRLVKSTEILNKILIKFSLSFSTRLTADFVEEERVKAYFALADQLTYRMGSVGEMVCPRIVIPTKYCRGNPNTRHFGVRKWLQPYIRHICC